MSVWKNSIICREHAAEIARKEIPILAAQRKLRRENMRIWRARGCRISELDIKGKADRKAYTPSNKGIFLGTSASRLILNFLQDHDGEFFTCRQIGVALSMEQNALRSPIDTLVRNNLIVRKGKERSRSTNGGSQILFGFMPTSNEELLEKLKD